MPPPRANAIAQAREHLMEVLAPVVAETGYDLEDVTVTSAGRRSLVRVIVDADGGVDLDAVAEVSRVVSDALDSETPGGPAFSGPYVLEVSSPGVDRPLTEPRHWRRAVGRLVTVTVGEQQLTGRVKATDDSGVTLEVDGSPRELGWSELGKGKVQIEFNRSGEE
ncbi:MAG TPA: ribosome maturation factor RimP [Jatrophihabitans sp.]|jgi:ribosome maturation factor RimP